MLLFELEQQIKPLGRNEKFELIRYLLELIAVEEPAEAQHSDRPESFLQAARAFAGCIANTPPDLSQIPRIWRNTAHDPLRHY